MVKITISHTANNFISIEKETGNTGGFDLDNDING
jgi:hypothetical protein